MVAEVTAAGGDAAIVGRPDIGCWPPWRSGRISAARGDIGSRDRPVEVATVLIDGMDLVALGLGGRRYAVPGAGGGRPRRAKAAPAGHRRRRERPTRLQARWAAMTSRRAGSGRARPAVRADQQGALQVSGVCAGGRRSARPGRDEDGIEFESSSSQVLAIGASIGPRSPAAAATGPPRWLRSRSRWPPGRRLLIGRPRGRVPRRGLRRREAATRCPQPARRDRRILTTTPLFQGVVTRR